MFFSKSIFLITLAVSIFVAANPEPQPTSLPKVERRYPAKRQADLSSALSAFSDQFSGLDTASIAAEASSLLNDPEFSSAYSSALSQATQPGFLSSALNDPAVSSNLAEQFGSSSAAAILSSASAAASNLPGGPGGGSDSASQMGVASLTTLLGISMGAAAIVFAL